MSQATARPRPAREAPALTITPSAASVRSTRLIAGAVVAGPVLGAVAAVGLAFARGGISTFALVAFALAYLLSTLGVTLGFHRYFSHRSFETSRALQAIFVVLGSTALQGPLLYWVSTHRRHHAFSDRPEDPHSPHVEAAGASGGVRGFWRSHVGWLFARQVTNPVRFAPDLLRDRLIFGLQRRYAVWAALGLALPPMLAWAATRSGWTMLETFLWAGPVRLVILHNASWAVGSVSHLVGARPFRTDDHSANNVWVALVAFGEGLQNNHHAFPRAAVHGLRWHEPDLTGLVVRLMAALGLIWELHQPAPAAVDARRRTLQEPSP